MMGVCVCMRMRMRVVGGAHASVRWGIRGPARAAPEVKVSRSEEKSGVNGWLSPRTYTHARRCHRTHPHTHTCARTHHDSPYHFAPPRPHHTTPPPPPTRTYPHHDNPDTPTHTLTHTPIGNFSATRR